MTKHLTQLTIALCAFLLATSTHAQTWTGNVSTSWNDPLNWSPNVIPAAGSTATIPASVASNRFPVIDAPLSLDFVVFNFGQLTFDADVTNKSYLFCAQNSKVINNAHFTNAGNVFHDSRGDFINTGIYANDGTIEVQGLFHNSGSFVNNHSLLVTGNGFFLNEGTLTNNSNIVIGCSPAKPSCDLSKVARFDNRGLVDNIGIVFNFTTAKFFNYEELRSSGTFEVMPCSEFFQLSDIPVTDVLWNMGVVYVIESDVATSDMDGIRLTSLDDAPQPTALCQDAQVSLDENGQAIITPELIDAGSRAPYCEINTLQVSPTFVDCNDVGTKTVTLLVTDKLGNTASCEAKVTVVSSTACTGGDVEVCTYTQGFYGNAGGIKFGRTTLEIIQDALSDDNGNDQPIVLGVGERTLTFHLAQAACIIELLPGGGPLSALPKANVVVGENCEVAPVPTKNGRFKNNLLAQTLTLTISARNDADLAALPLQSACIDVPASLFDLLDEDATVSDLLALANRALGGQVAKGYFSAINEAISSINEYFDDCNLACLGNRAESSDVLTLSSFRTGTDVQLVWITNTEVRNEYFVIERSTNGIEFEALETIPSRSLGKGPRHYAWFDRFPYAGNNFYRIKQVALDGSVSYSNVAAASFGIDPAAVIAYPNPATDVIHLNLKEYAGKAATVEIVNAYGIPLKHLTFDSVPVDAISISLDGIPGGVYAIRIEAEGHRALTRTIMVSDF